MFTPSRFSAVRSYGLARTHAPVEEGGAMQNRHEFAGLSPRMAKRRALNYWYTHRDSLGMSVSEFFGCCRVSTQGGITRIIFYGRRDAA
jgi:hypothetical protein